MDLDSISIQVTHVEIRIPRRSTEVRAFARVEVNGALVIDNFRVKRADTGRLTVEFPACLCRATCPGCGRRTDAKFPACGWCAAELPRGETFRPTVYSGCPTLTRHVEAAVLRAYVDATTAETLRTYAPQLKVISA